MQAIFGKEPKMVSLGELTLEQKQQIWGKRMSGSQVKRVFSDATNLFEEFTGKREIVDLSQTKAAKFLSAGNYMEPVIVDMAKTLEPELFGNIVVDKDTFELQGNEYYTANIDGYIGESIDNIDYIVEIKNTTVSDPNKLLASYEGQCRYYSALFNAKKGAVLIYLLNGNELKWIFIPRDAIEEDKLFRKIEDFKLCVDLDSPPVEFVDHGVELSDEQGDTIKTELREKLERLTIVKDLAKDIKAEEDMLKKDIEALVGHDKYKIVSEGYTFTSAKQVRNTFNKDGAIEELLKETGKDLPTLRKGFLTQSETTILRVKKNKGDE